MAGSGTGGRGSLGFEAGGTTGVCLGTELVGAAAGAPAGGFALGCLEGSAAGAGPVRAFAGCCSGTTANDSALSTSADFRCWASASSAEGKDSVPIHSRMPWRASSDRLTN